MKWTLASIALTTALFFMAAACQPANTEKKIAADLCDCLRPMTESYRQLQERSESASDGEKAELKAKLEAAGAESEECTENIQIEYGETVEKQEEKIKAVMETICPEVVAALVEIDAAYE